MADTVSYKSKAYLLIGISGTGLPAPADFEIEPLPTCTGCWRGYLRHFKCITGELVLDSLEINAKDPPAINGVDPHKGRLFFEFRYSGLGLKVHFSGDLLLGKDFIQEMYVHMGFQRVIAYATVLAIRLDDGTITEVRDLSAQCAELRAQDPGRGSAPRSGDPKDVMEWIAMAFSQDSSPEDL